MRQAAFSPPLIRQVSDRESGENAAPRQGAARRPREPLELAGDDVEHGVEIGADGDERGNDGDGDERGDETILDRGDAGLVLQETMQQAQHGSVLRCYVWVT